MSSRYRTVLLTDEQVTQAVADWAMRRNGSWDAQTARVRIEMDDGKVRATVRLEPLQEVR